MDCDKNSSALAALWYNERSKNLDPSVLWQVLDSLESLLSYVYEYDVHKKLTKFWRIKVSFQNMKDMGKHRNFWNRLTQFLLFLYVHEWSQLSKCERKESVFGKIWCSTTFRILCNPCSHIGCKLSFLLLYVYEWCSTKSAALAKVWRIKVRFQNMFWKLRYIYI